MSDHDERRVLDDFVRQVEDYAIIALDQQGVIQTWNLGAERVKGYTAGEAIGRHFSMFYTEADRETGLPMRLLGRAVASGRVEHRGWRVRKDGSRFWGDVVITALRDDEGQHVGFAKVTRDLTEQHQLEEALRASEERLRLLVGQVVDYAIIALDPQGVIQTWNLGAERVKGYTAEEAIGRHFSMFYPEEDRRAGLPARLLNHAQATGRVDHAGWRVRKDGSPFWGDVVITALHDADGNLTGYAKVTRDRTDLKLLQQAQDAFYANFSHDFRAPLTAIRGFAEAIRDTEGPARDLMLGRVEANADRLLRMVQDLMDFATQRESHASIELEDVDLRNLVQGAVDGLAPELHAERVTITGPSVVVRANAMAMSRVVTNLLINALTYSPAGTPVVVSLWAQADGTVQLDVCDQGRGIDPHDLDTIFNEFERGRHAEDDGGTGLGLASVRTLVRQQDGKVTIRSVVGEGTTVSVGLAAGGAATGLPEQRDASAPARLDVSS